MLFLFSLIYDFWIKKEIKEKTWLLPGISTIPRRKLIVNKQESTARGRTSEKIQSEHNQTEMGHGRRGGRGGESSCWPRGAAWAKRSIKRVAKTMGEGHTAPGLDKFGVGDWVCHSQKGPVTGWNWGYQESLAARSALIWYLGTSAFET